MRSPFRWFRRRAEYALMGERTNVLESEFSLHLGRKCRFVPAAAKGGYDMIFYVLDGSRRIAVARVNNPDKSNNDPIGELDPGVPLGSEDRLQREWMAYRKLHPLGLSPQPMWRSDDCIVLNIYDILNIVKIRYPN